MKIISAKKDTSIPECQAIAERFPLKILVAEDNIINQMVIRELLAQMGYQIVIAENGLRVLETLDQERFDLILMDIEMPKMDGLEATRRIRAQAESEPVSFSSPVIAALTADTTAETRLACSELGMDAYMTKPVRTPMLVQLFESIFSNNTGEDQKG